jgi:hypothetical protein
MIDLHFSILLLYLLGNLHLILLILLVMRGPVVLVLAVLLGIPKTQDSFPGLMSLLSPTLGRIVDKGDDSVVQLP